MTRTSKIVPLDQVITALVMLQTEMATWMGASIKAFQTNPFGGAVTGFVATAIPLATPEPKLTPPAMHCPALPTAAYVPLQDVPEAPWTTAPSVLIALPPAVDPAPKLATPPTLMPPPILALVAESGPTVRLDAELFQLPATTVPVASMRNSGVDSVESSRSRRKPEGELSLARITWIAGSPLACCLKRESASNVTFPGTPEPEN